MPRKSDSAIASSEITFDEAMDVVKRLRSAGISVTDIRELETNSPILDSNVAGISINDPDYVHDDKLHQFTALVFENAIVRTSLASVKSVYKQKGPVDWAIGLATAAYADQLRGVNAVVGLPGVNLAMEQALKIF